MDGRIRLRQWLEGRLNTGYIPGLVWLDKSKSIFKIPWKHHSKHTWQEDDAAIFKDWAVVTGRYREGLDVPDWPMWKTRLRCALNKAPDIQEVRQHHNLHCDEPFKVYRFISKTESMWRANATRHASLIFDGVPSATTGIINHSNNADMPQFFPANSRQSHATIRSPNSSISDSNIYPKRSALSKPITLIQKTEEGHIKLKYINIPVHKSNVSACYQPTPGEVGRTKIHFSCTSLKSPPLSLLSTPLNNTSHSPLPLSVSLGNGRQTNKLTFGGLSVTGTGGYSFNDANVANIGSHVTVTSVVNNSTANTAGAVSQSPGKIRLADVMEPELHQICLRIQHLEHRVSDMIVNNPNGCCIYFGRFDENLCSAGPEPIEPQIQQFVSDCNKYCVDMLLDNMQRGVVLTILNGSIYAEKLCKCATFVYRPGNNGEFYFVDKLNRRDKMLIFDFRSFLEELHYFQRGMGDKPHVELILAFGQQIKENSSPESLYVWCRLASCKAWFLLQRSLSSQCKQTVLSNSNGNSSNNGAIKKSCSNNHSDSSNLRKSYHRDQQQRHCRSLSGVRHDSLSGMAMHINDVDSAGNCDNSGTDHSNRSADSGDDICDSDAGGGGGNNDGDGGGVALEHTEEVVTEDLIEIDHMVYTDNCLSDELGIGVGHEVSIEHATEDFPSLHFQPSFESRTRFEETDLSFQFDSSGYDFK